MDDRTSANPGEAYRLTNLALFDTNQDAAIALLEKALSYDSRSKIIYFHLGMIFAARGLYDRAASQFRIIVETIDDQDAPSWFLLARQLHLSSDINGALRAYEETIRRDPLCEKAYLYSARILLAERRELTRALSLAEAARRLRPASCMLPVGEFDETLEEARRVVQQIPLNTLHPGTIESSRGIDLPDPDYSGVPVRLLIERYPEIVESLESWGIMCGDCAGYGDQTLADLSTVLEFDLESLVESVRVNVSGTV